ncbi:minor capsid protein [Liquorilactobacillus satsumensis]|uniref:phage minor capsid protein n=1 Tax=Liquorilactobacillus satsumensis TaxID=259059 RepID=UPI0021C2A2A4|nr:phage minor capsid protein [Liquorilactobacillus satsumensis]MCP9357380.1 minor capsid protein [Liquorilactobacillus satsumensis]MCP9372060.1 minor capsid protein [Liquorilactobacillus satsumensis]
MVTQEQMNNKANQIAEYYSNLQQHIFYLIIDATKNTRSLSADHPNMLEWRLEMLSKMGALTDETIKLVAKTSNESEKAIRLLIQQDGLQVAKDINKQLSGMLNKQVSVSQAVNQIISSYTAQTFKDIDNNVNQTLLTTNYSHNGASKAFQDIVNKTALEVQTGLKTPQRALADNIYKWRDEGIKSNLVDKGGHQWSLEGYTRTVLNSTAGRTFNDVRIQSMKDFKSPLAVMSSHPMSRKACAYIQGRVVNIVAPSDPLYNDKYDSIYNHGYGTPAGTLGINCAHHLYPYIEGVSHNYQEQYDPEKVQEKADIQAKQRYYERSIRAFKYDLDLANKMNDEAGQTKYKANISNYQAKLRDIVSQNDFLNRQYDREQVVK